MQDNYYKEGIRSIKDVHRRFEGKYGYKLRFDTPQYDTIKNYIRRLNKFARARKPLPTYKAVKEPKGAITRSKGIKRGRGRPRKYPKAIIDEDPEDEGPNEAIIFTTVRRSRNKKYEPVDELMGRSIINTTVQYNLNRSKDQETIAKLEEDLRVLRNEKMASQKSLTDLNELVVKLQGQLVEKNETLEAECASVQKVDERANGWAVVAELLGG